MAEKILNIAAGKFIPLDVKEPFFLVNVDTMFFYNIPPANVESDAVIWQRDDFKSTEVHNVNSDIFQFMERTILTFDQVAIYRFLEHVSFTQVSYFIYLVSTVTEPGAIVDVIVPNYRSLAEMLLEENPRYGNFEKNNILLTTELLNEPSCPHASIWTSARAVHFWELEGRFKVEGSQEHFTFDGRDIYLRFKAKRI